ncbi:unnamed protein product [Rhodiola kirilowii]
MLACISCSKQVGEGEEDEGGRGGGNGSKEAVKSLTSQIKEMALKLKPTATSSTTYRRDHRPHPDFDTSSKTAPYLFNTRGSSSSTPAWDFPSTGRQPGASSSDAPFTSGAVRREGVSTRNVEAEEENDGLKEWMAQVEPGVHITFMSLPNGGNDLKRIRFSREIFDKWQAQRWWGENYDRILELYNVQRFNQQALQTPARSEDERDSSYSRMDSVRESPMMTPASTRDWMPRHYYNPGSGSKGYHPYPSEQDDQHYSHHHHIGSSAYGGPRGEKPSFDAASQATASERDEPSVSMSNASEMDNEWVEEDEPGVYITIRQLTDGTKELRRVRFSRERFGEVNAKSWWEQNRERIQAQYL